MRDTTFFSRFARMTARITGRSSCFMLAVVVIVVWAITGPLFHFSDTWQLVINTATTIITFLMVFLIQNTQYRDSEAVQLKLDELIRALRGAENRFLDLEELTEDELDDIKQRYLDLAERAREKLENKSKDPDRGRGHSNKKKEPSAKSRHGLPGVALDTMQHGSESL